MTNPYTLPEGNVQIAFSGGRTSAYMLKKGPITHMDANRIGVLCFTARIDDLRKRGHVIECEMQYPDHGNKFGLFTLRDAT